MLAKTHIHEMARQVCNLLECDTALLLLGCTEPELGHPLLHFFSPSTFQCVGFHGSLTTQDVLQHEQIALYCDSALLRGLAYWLNNVELLVGGVWVRSIAIVPLERPAGLLGLLILTDSQENAFYQGEQLLLQSFLPSLGSVLEQYLQTSATSYAIKELTQKQQKVEGCDRQSQQKELDRLKNEFISMVSHELRSPLTAIKGYAGLLQVYGLSEQREPATDTDMTPARQQHYLDVIMEQANHLEVLIGDLLDTTRIQAGRLTLRRTFVDVASLCQRVVQLMQQRVDQQQGGLYTIRCIAVPALPSCWVDPDRVQQILTNLLENAIKYSPNGGCIEVLASLRVPMSRLAMGTDHVAQPTDVVRMVSVTVRDQGIGIAPESTALLFQPFSRLSHPSAVHVPGAGLGLYITRKLVEAMGGAITLSSREGQGTSITFTLPIELPYEAPIPEHVPLVVSGNENGNIVVH